MAGSDRVPGPTRAMVESKLLRSSQDRVELGHSTAKLAALVEVILWLLAVVGTWLVLLNSDQGRVSAVLSLWIFSLVGVVLLRTARLVCAHLAALAQAGG